VEAFEKKLYEHYTGEVKGNISNMTIKPITKLRYTDPTIGRDVKFQHILIFAISGLLVIFCSLFNYLTLFVSRFRIRQKELALRVVCGASGGSLLAMLSVEFLLTLLFAVVLGSALTQLVYEPFLTISDITMNLSAIYREMFTYVGGIILFSFLVFWLILFIFRRRSLNLSIRQKNKKLFRKVSVVAQLVISIGFAFCTIVILKQMYFLHHTNELGFSFQNRGTVYTGNGEICGILANHLKQIPEITEVVDAGKLSDLVHGIFRMSGRIDLWDDKPVDADDINFEKLFVSQEYTVFYDFQLVAGEMLTDTDPESLVLLNESAVKAFGWHDPVGKRFDNFYTVKGVIRNVYNFAPTVEAQPILYLIITPQNATGGSATVLFKYHEGMWKSCKEKIEKLFEKEYDGLNQTIINSEEEYEKF
jgi:hypothetical protein